MTLTKKGKYWYGTSLDDLKAEIIRYSKLRGYEAAKFSESVCKCGSHLFKLETDEEEGVARRVCNICTATQVMGDGANYASEAQFEKHECVCGEEVFHLLSGVALYENTSDVRWYYIDCQCEACKLVGVFADWKCEAGNAEEFLAKT